MTDQTIGIIGVGLMGLGIATNIQKAGYALCFLDHPGNQDTSDLKQKGATACKTAAEIARICDSVILCVTGSPEVEDVLTRTDGVNAGLTPGTLVIDCSTAIPQETLKMAASVTQAGGRFIDAPMTRTPKEAMAGKLNLIVGGTKEDCTDALPLLQTFAENITYAGETSAGHALKLLHNFVSLGFSTLLAEAIASADKSGIDRSVFHEVLAAGGGGGVILDRMSPYMLEKDNSSFRFTVAKTHKDIGYYLDMCDGLEAHSDVAKGVQQLLHKQIEQERGSHFVPELIDFLSE